MVYTCASIIWEQQCEMQGNKNDTRLEIIIEFYLHSNLISIGISQFSIIRNSKKTVRSHIDNELGEAWLGLKTDSW